MLRRPLAMTSVLSGGSQRIVGGHGDRAGSRLVVVADLHDGAGLVTRRDHQRQGVGRHGRLSRAAAEQEDQLVANLLRIALLDRLDRNRRQVGGDRALWLSATTGWNRAAGPCRPKRPEARRGSATAIQRRLDFGNDRSDDDIDDPLRHDDHLARRLCPRAPSGRNRARARPSRPQLDPRRGQLSNRRASCR